MSDDFLEYEVSKALDGNNYFKPVNDPAAESLKTVFEQFAVLLFRDEYLTAEFKETLQTNPMIGSFRFPFYIQNKPIDMGRVTVLDSDSNIADEGNFLCCYFDGEHPPSIMFFNLMGSNDSDVFSLDVTSFKLGDKIRFHPNNTQEATPQ